MNFKKYTIYLILLIFATTIFYECTTKNIVSDNTPKKITASDIEVNSSVDEKNENNPLVKRENSLVLKDLEILKKLRESSSSEMVHPPTDAFKGDDYTFILEAEETPDEAYSYKAHYLYDAKTNTNHRLLLPWGNVIVGKRGNNIIYCGNNKTYLADLKSLRVKPLLDDELSLTITYNPLLKRKLNLFFEITEDWLYYCELNFYTEIPQLFKLNIHTGEKILFEKSNLICANYFSSLTYPDYTMHRNFIFDERGLIPQRGKNAFCSYRDLNEKWNRILHSFSFGEKGLFKFNNHTSWNNFKRIIILKIMKKFVSFGVYSII